MSPAVVPVVIFPKGGDIVSCHCGRILDGAPSDVVFGHGVALNGAAEMDRKAVGQ